MRARDPTSWMWSEALELLERAERIQRQCFRLGEQRNSCPTWEPPVDLFETATAYLVLAALPGVAPGQLFISLDGATLSVCGQRPMPVLETQASIHRVEIPYGRFERRIELPSSHLSLGQHLLRDGCLLLTLDKTRRSS